jgi:acetyltransferase-like isoleucine patch superfamily enzyme
MLLSVILNEMGYQGIYKLINEKHFKYLALTASEIEEPNCIYLDTHQHIENIKDSVSMVLTTEELIPLLTDHPFGLCIVEKPRELFFQVHNYLSNSDDCVRHRFASRIGENCEISPFSIISEHNVIIGNNVTIEEFVVIRENCYIGDNSILRAGCKIGGQGFEFKRQDNCIADVAHLGGVIIGNHVEIQYNTCIDRAVFPWDNTIVGDYCKIDNLVHIAHGVKLGNNVLVVANSGIGGRTIIKDGTWIGFGATIRNGLIIGKNARANMGAVVTKSVPDNSSVTGNFAIDHKDFVNQLKSSLLAE